MMTQVIQQHTSPSTRLGERRRFREADSVFAPLTPVAAVIRPPLRNPEPP